MAWYTRLRRLAGPLPQPSIAPPIPAPPPADPNAPYIFQPGPAPSREGVVTLDELYHLSRLP